MPVLHTDWEGDARCARRTKSLLLAGLASASALALAVPAHAQAQLEEVIVTARKRQESILNVPVITTAVGGETIQRMQVNNVQGLARLVPGLIMSEQALANGVQISLRGVGTTALDPGIDQSVALNIDGLTLTQGLAFHSAMFDVGQVEVYKGPQSLFYGKSSPGGVVSLRSADPTNTPEIIARAGYEFYAKEWQQELILSGPVAEGLKMRLAVRHSDSDGYFYNRAHGIPGSGSLVTDDSRVGGTKRWMARGTVLWNPTSNFDARLKYNYAHDRIKWAGTGQFVGCPEGIRALAPALPAGSAPIPFLDPADNCKLDRSAYIVGMDPAHWPNIPFGGVPTLDQFQRYGTLEMNYHPREDITLTSVTGYYSVRTEVLLNSSQTSDFGGPAASQNDYRRREYTQELRANSDFTGPVNFTAGAYFQDAQVNQQVTQRTSDVLDARIVAPVFLPQTRALGGIRNSSAINELQIRSKSFFGQLRYKIIPEVELSGGARWTDERRSYTSHALPQWSNVPGLVAGGYVPLKTPSRDTKNWSPEFTVTYRPTDDMTLFASWKKGYKSGSYNMSTLAAAASTSAFTYLPPLENSYADETVKGFEGGVKARLFDRRMNVNFTPYYYKYGNLQVGAVLPATPGSIPITQTLNAARAKIYGVDFDVAYLAMEDLTLKASINYNHARYSNFNNATCWTGQTQELGCNQAIVTNPVTGVTQGFAQDLTGAPLVRAPDWQGVFGFTWEKPFSNGMKVIVDNSNQFSSKYLTTLATRADIRQGGFFKSDIVVSLLGVKDQWEVSIAGRNIFNKYTLDGCNLSNYEGTPFQVIPATTGFRAPPAGPGNGPAGQAEGNCYADPGRTVTLTFTWRPLAR
jgi:iron complex outermembrane receptor protein